jgi:hypothetical protein
MTGQSGPSTTFREGVPAAVAEAFRRSNPSSTLQFLDALRGLGYEVVPSDSAPMMPEDVEWVRSQRVTEPTEPDECRALPEGSGRCAYAGPDGQDGCGETCRYLHGISSTEPIMGRALGPTTQKSTFIGQARRRNDALRALHAPGLRNDEPHCLCGRQLERCGTWTDMQTIAALLDVAEAAQALDAIVEGALMSVEQQEAVNALHVALQKLPQVLSEGES